MLLQTNSYIVPKDKRAEHARLLRRFRASLAKLGCDSFEVYEQVGSNWTTGEPTGRYVQIMRFRDRRHQLSVQAAERSDPGAQAIIAEFCQLINFPYQQQQGLFAVGFYNSVLPVAPSRPHAAGAAPADPHADATAVAEAPSHEEAATPEHDAGPVGPDVAIDEIGGGGPEGEFPEVEHAKVEYSAGEGGEAESHPHGGEPLDPQELDIPAVDAEPDEQSDSPVVAEADEVDGGAVGEGIADVPDRGEHRDAGEADASNGETAGSTSDTDELGSLLNAHLDAPPAAEGADHAEGLAETESAEDGAVGLDAMELDALDLPDAPSPGSQHASKPLAH